MSQELHGAFKTFTAGEALEAYRRVKLNGSGAVVYAAAKEPAIGITASKIASGGQVTVRLLNDAGTFKVATSAAVAALALVYGTASGKVDDVATAIPGSCLGLALEASTGDGGIIEVMPIPDQQGVRMVAGQHTTVAAADTLVTGLATVFGVVATLDSDPSDDPELVSATIGDQAGTPAAGSIIIKTWKNGATDPTPAAATTFTKKVNWIAWGK